MKKLEVVFSALKGLFLFKNRVTVSFLDIDLIDFERDMLKGKIKKVAKIYNIIKFNIIISDLLNDNKLYKNEKLNSYISLKKNIE